MSVQITTISINNLSLTEDLKEPESIGVENVIWK